MSNIVKIIAKPKYLIVSILVAVIMITLAAWLPNLHLIARTVINSNITLGQKTNLMISLLGSLETNFTIFARRVMIASAGLAGMQVSLFIYYLRRSLALHQAMGLSGFGIATSFLGIGCVSCGSILLTTLIGFGAMSTVLGFLPFRGEEFGVIGIAIQLIALDFTAKKIKSPDVCSPT